MEKTKALSPNSENNKHQRPYDIIVFGAEGGTGLFVVKALSLLPNHSCLSNSKVRWAVAGQSISDLDQTLGKVTEIVGKDLKNIPRIQADALDFLSLKRMASSTKVVINCVGPFYFFGENVTQACVEERTHLIEISGEVQFLMRRYLKFNKAAQEADIYVVGSCGFFSLLMDCGTRLLQRTFKGQLVSVEGVADMWNYSDKRINLGSHLSMTYLYATLHQRKGLVKQIFGEGFLAIRSKFGLSKPLIHYSRALNGWLLRADIMADSLVTSQTQNYISNQEPVKAEFFFRLPLLVILFQVLYGIVFCLVCQFKWGRDIIKAYPRATSLGTCQPGKRISHQALEAVEFKYHVRATGSPRSLEKDGTASLGVPTTIAEVTFSGKNPIYGATAIIAVQAALVLLFEKDNLPSKGGVYTPGLAFDRTTLLERLEENGIQIQVNNEGKVFNSLREARSKVL